MLDHLCHILVVREGALADSDVDWILVGVINSIEMLGVASNIEERSRFRLAIKQVSDVFESDEDLVLADRLLTTADALLIGLVKKELWHNMDLKVAIETTVIVVIMAGERGLFKSQFLIGVNLGDEEGDRLINHALDSSLRRFCLGIVEELKMIASVNSDTLFVHRFIYTTIVVSKEASVLHNLDASVF